MTDTTVKKSERFAITDSGPATYNDHSTTINQVVQSPSKSPHLGTILFLAINPKSTKRRIIDNEKRQIEEALRRFNSHDHYALKEKIDIQIDDLRQTLLESKPRILHFSGRSSSVSSILFKDRYGSILSNSADTIGEFFQAFANHIECVILNGCYNQSQAEAIAKHIRYVIGISQQIDDKKAIEFIFSFYEVFAADLPIKFAFDVARTNIQIHGQPKELLPILVGEKSEETKVTLKHLSSNIRMAAALIGAKNDTVLKVNKGNIREELSKLPILKVITHEQKELLFKLSSNSFIAALVHEAWQKRQADKRIELQDISIDDIALAISDLNK